MNLVSNAIKFSQEDGDIFVNTIVNDDTFCLLVKDTGIGIPEEDKEHLFGRFFRGHNVTNIQGTGLGLHIVGKYVELMNGNIECNSTLNTGTGFTITFKSNNQQ